MFTPDDADAEDGPVPMPGDVVLVEDRQGCRHCTAFAPSWDRYQSVFTDSMFTIDAANPPGHLKHFVSSANGRVPTVMIVSEEQSQRANPNVSSALRKFIQKSHENDHTPEEFIGNIGILSRRVGDNLESRSLAMLHAALQNNLDLARTIERVSKKIGGYYDAPAPKAPEAEGGYYDAPAPKAPEAEVEKAESFVVQDLEPPASASVTISASVDDTPDTGLSSILDHLAIEDSETYEDTMY